MDILGSASCSNITTTHTYFGVSLSSFCHFREPTDVQQRVAACLRLNKIVFIIICTIPVKLFELLVCLLPNAVI